jgi:hypothetical protein
MIDGARKRAQVLVLISPYASRVPQRGETQMGSLKPAILGTLKAAAALSAVTLAPALTQAVISEPSQNKGQGTPTPIRTTSAARTPPPGRAIRRSALRCGGGRASTLPRRTCTDISYFSELLSDANFELSLPPVPFTLEMIASEIPAAMSRRFRRREISSSLFIAVASASPGA